MRVREIATTLVLNFWSKWRVTARPIPLYISVNIEEREKKPEGRLGGSCNDDCWLHLDHPKKAIPSEWKCAGWKNWFLPLPLPTTMVSRLALARLAPVLGVARPSTSAVSRRTLRGFIRGYATTDNDHTVSNIITKFCTRYLNYVLR